MSCTTSSMQNNKKLAIISSLFNLLAKARVVTFAPHTISLWPLPNSNLWYLTSSMRNGDNYHSDKRRRSSSRDRQSYSSHSRGDYKTRDRDDRAYRGHGSWKETTYDTNETAQNNNDLNATSSGDGNGTQVIPTRIIIKGLPSYTTESSVIIYCLNQLLTTCLTWIFICNFIALCNNSCLLSARNSLVTTQGSLTTQSCFNIENDVNDFGESLVGFRRMQGLCVCRFPFRWIFSIFLAIIRYGLHYVVESWRIVGLWILYLSDVFLCLAGSAGDPDAPQLIVDSRAVSIDYAAEKKGFEGRDKRMIPSDWICEAGSRFLSF